MARILDLTTGPVLGRLRGINRKHRFRSRYHQPIEDWPDPATIDVLDRAALERRDHLPCADAIFVVSDKLKAVLSALAPDVKFFPADAGGRRVWVVAPFDGDLMYQNEVGTRTEYSQSGYQVTHATGLRVDGEPQTAWCNVRNTPLLALGAELLAAATQANIVWDPVDSIADYRPHRDHPYSVVQSSRGASAHTLEVLDPWPPAPAAVAHPLHEWVRDASLKVANPSDAWSKLVHPRDVDDFQHAAIARYCSGLPLPRLRALLDPDCAKSKLKKRWKEATEASSMKMGILVVNAAVTDLLGPSCRFTPIELRCPVLDKAHAGFFVAEPPTVEWIDWARSDVAYRRNAMYDGFAGLHPIEDSYSATQPIVRVSGTNLILIHRSIAEQLGKNLYVKPLHEISVGLNLDEYVRAG